MDNWTAVGVALIAAAAGLGGAFLGARVSARATLQATERASEEARLSRFSDRIRELGAIVLATADRFTEAVNEDVLHLNLGNDIPRHIRELRLVVRHEATGKLLDELQGTLIVLDTTRAGAEWEDKVDLRNSQVRESRELQEKLEDALRSELELPPAPHSWW